MTKKIFLKRGREKSVLRRHPWIFSGGIERVEGDLGLGESVQVCSETGVCLGWGSYSPLSQIRIRMWNWDPPALIGEEFFSKKIDQALALRQKLVRIGETNAVRLVYAESDGIPGLIADRYENVLVIQILSAGAEYWKDVLVDLLVQKTGLQRVYERSDVDVRRLEGLQEQAGLLRGNAVSEPVVIHENGLLFGVDIEKGQKTGFYIDQRRNRQVVRDLSEGREVLNCFCYTGGFSAYALAGKARHVTSIDSSAEAINQGRANLLRNGLDENQADWLEGDVFRMLRLYRDQGKQFDLIILDPPKFAPTAAQVEKAARGYKDINLLAIKLLRPGGFLVTFSCSGGISPDLFQKIVTGAAEDAQAELEIVDQLHQGPDHPILVSFPESEYLKGLVCYKK